MIERRRALEDCTVFVRLRQENFGLFLRRFWLGASGGRLGGGEDGSDGGLKVRGLG